MKDNLFQNQLRESRWRCKPAETEAALWRTPPEMAEDLDLESRLTVALTRLPDAAVASNFTARVMQAVELDAASRSRGWRWNWRSFLPRAAIAAVVLVFAGLAWQHHEQFVQRAGLARSLALLTESQPLPSVEALKNFDTIQRMGQPHADEELIALLQ